MKDLVIYPYFMYSRQKTLDGFHANSRETTTNRKILKHSQFRIKNYSPFQNLISVELGPESRVC